MLEKIIEIPYVGSMPAWAIGVAAVVVVIVLVSVVKKISARKVDDSRVQKEKPAGQPAKKEEIRVEPKIEQKVSPKLQAPKRKPAPKVVKKKKKFLGGSTK